MSHTLLLRFLHGYEDFVFLFGLVFVIKMNQLFVGTYGVTKRGQLWNDRMLYGISYRQKCAS